MGSNGGDVEDITRDTSGEAILEEGAPCKGRGSSEGTVVHEQPMPGQERVSASDRYI